MSDFMEPDIELSQFIRKIKLMCRNGEYESAIRSCSLLVDNKSTRVAGLRMRADLYADMRKRELEVADREKLVEVEEKEPADHFDLGIALWRSGNLERAVEIFTRGLVLGEQENFNYYSNATRMHLVALLIALGRMEEARRECEKIPDGYESYLPGDGVVSRESLLDRIVRSHKP